ncbi:uncharacterized protein A1O9_03940 [Exophiala aquamarina CBS 119918]|uniref:Uncharacterized protein n=1 Tax=Exophiala aquamarina CBS 119918 TaxID=1182545 RepID=A0A072PGV3_9EURO|nr:uncharacterized protein A1O9_03940 [Exophiala aquamarina CBS 119918]KEF59096.1 hypothetical protein A1O9_03940 [Exophiala aquamarina CBS 119918]
MPEAISGEKQLADIQHVQPSQPPPVDQRDLPDKDTIDYLNVVHAVNGGDGASHSTTLTTTPLVRDREPAEQEPDAAPNAAQDSALQRFTSTTRRDGRHLREPPELPFNLRHHKLSLSIFTFLALAECCFVPVAFYYGFSQGTNVRSGIYFAIITSLFGFVSGYEFGIRGWRLVKVTDEYRPLFGSPRFWGFDSTNFVLMMPFTVMTIILIIFSIPHYPSVKALALPMPVGMINIGVIFVINGWAAQRGWRLIYFRLSSHVKNSICPPLTFCIMEDICAVDGKGGKKYRQAALERYNASPRFRALLLQLLWFWAIPAIVVGAALIAAIYSTTDDIAYGIGWGAPTVWVGIWTWITVIWVQRALRIEKETWVSDRTSSA